MENESEDDFKKKSSKTNNDHYNMWKNSSRKQIMNKAQEQRRQRRRQLQRKTDPVSSPSSSQYNNASIPTSQKTAHFPTDNNRKNPSSPNRRPQARRDWSDQDEDSYEDTSEHDVDFDPNDGKNDRVERRRASHRLPKHKEPRRRGMNSHQQNERSIDPIEENRSVNNPSKYNFTKATSAKLDSHHVDPIPSQQYSKPTQNYMENFHEDHDNPPPIISKATSETSQVSNHLHNSLSHDSYSRSQNFSVRYSESIESRDTQRVQHINQNNTYRHEPPPAAQAHIAPNYHNHIQHPHPHQHQQLAPQHNLPKDDATADYTTMTEDSGGARLHHYHHNVLEQHHETFRSRNTTEFQQTGEYPDFDDETTVFDTNTVNTLEEDDPHLHSHHLHKQQRRQDSYLSGGYSSLGRGTGTGTGTGTDTMPNSVLSSTSETKNNSKDNGREISGNSSVTNNRNHNLRNNHSIHQQDTTITNMNMKQIKSNPSIDSDQGTQLTYEDDNDTQKSSRWDSSHPTSYNHTQQQQQQVEEDFSKTFQQIGSDEEKIKMAAGCTAAAALGAIVIGPIGLLVGASVGLVGGFYQIPHEKRSKVANVAKSSFAKATDKALKTSENLSNSCVTAFERNGFEVPDNCLPKRGEQEDGSDTMGGGYHNPSWLTNHFDIKDDGSDAERFRRDNKDDEGTIESATDGLLGNLGGVIANVGGDGGDGGDKGRRRAVACLRKARITPIGQIHSLKPSLQPRAWLDIMSSALTTDDEKNEAMEEILILVKDKEHAQIFLEEGILDSLMYILSTSFQKLPPPAPEISETDGSLIFHDKGRIPHNSKTFVHAKLAANCCVALGKAHCAVVHTEGDLLLMSAYNRGSVPVERQLAQLLFEVPHHSRMMGTNVGGILEDGTQEEFILTEMSMQQAEEMAKNIKALVEGRLEWN